MMFHKNTQQAFKGKARWLFPLLMLAGLLFSFSPATAQCSASFTYNVLNDSTVTFTNTSTYSGTQIDFVWTFGDGSYSYQENPNHGFASQGYYSVCLMVIDSPNSCWDNYCDTIWIGTKDCYANFSYNLNGTQVSFYNNSATTSGSLSYEWIFGDGSSNSTATNPVHNYNSGGLYNVILLAYKSGCADTIIKQIQVTPPSSCTARFQYYVTGNQVQFYDSSTYSGNVSFFWDFGDSTTSTSQDPLHTYTSAGFYQICLTISDTFNNCYDQYCDTLRLYSPGSCNADFSYYSAGNYKVAFTNHSTPSGGNMYWDFGDGSTSTAWSTTHTYATAPDSVLVSLTVSTSACADTVSKWVAIPAPIYRIIGSVWKSTNYNLSTQATAYLIKHDSSGGTLTLVDSTYADSFYSFNVLPGNKYLVKAALNSYDPDYNDYLPTYHDSSLFWSGASEVVVTSNQYYYQTNINLKAGTNPGGPGFIGGLISQGANKKTGPGDPLEGVEVMLLKMDNSPVAYTFSDADGMFSFDDIPFGQYQVYTEVFGKTTIPLIVELTEANPEKDNVEIAVGETTITGLFGSTFTSTPLTLDIFPNPSNGLLNIVHTTNESGNVSIRVLNHVGQEVLHTTEHAEPGQQNVWKIDITSLPRGLYLIEVMKSANGKAAVSVNKVVVE